MNRTGTLLHVPNSRLAFTRAQVTDLFAPPDWHPDSHPPMPAIVARGRKPDGHACGYCHLPDGTGRRDSAPGFRAYVPAGSIARGRHIAESGGGGLTLACVPRR